MTAHEQSKQRPPPPKAGSSEAGKRIATFIEQTVAAGATSEEVAAVVTEAFQRLRHALAPVVGQGGVAALYERALHLSRPAFPWLPVGQHGAPGEMDIASLTTSLATQTAANAGVAGVELVRNFRALLTALIGESLAERLLMPVWVTL